MKSKKLTKKLTLNKSTVARLDHAQQGAVKGGYLATEFYGGCNTWHPVCYSVPRDCPTIVEFTEYCD